MRASTKPLSDKGPRSAVYESSTLGKPFQNLNPKPEGTRIDMGSAILQRDPKIVDDPWVALAADVVKRLGCLRPAGV